MAQSKPTGKGVGAKCPICGRPTDTNYRPFCSRRCADVDLSRWLSGSYAIPAEEESDDPSAGDAPRDEPLGRREH